MRLYLDPGHGGSDPGATGNGLYEKNINLDIALRIRNILTSEYNNVQVRMSRTTDATVSLNQRTNDANTWNADYFLSVHCNSFNGSARGYEDYIHSSLSDGSQTAQYRNQVHSEVTKVNQLRNRGKKKANFHVLRESAMPAILTENGFIDNPSDAALMRSASWRQTVARGHVNGLAKAFNLTKKPGSGSIYRVVAGSFKSRDNAEQRVDMLQSKGINAFVDLVTISGQQWYRVQAGAFTNRSNAEEQLTKVKNAGVTDAYIVHESR
ncbi:MULTISPECIES: N-acetylmuramoyl-L-alanine amidase [Virgibacillus]|uniref:Sporulation-specific N-acetylmuramoyl-L-alanine amidase n=1 Tax=Virgibacillus massiliensis TaxID=1462526 RepID=A0A024Q865_9BACI|nr:MULTISPECIES: N-acetylmuramoyl-L-alanine amidase [Virgibacillus]EQB37233.1 N-acetylmuramoyl-L-alanine amidase [Virgibacillus sp. CM-4]CDQ38121.1 Sporulation-specific N-acetylmuramoyl-L-alanine amidase [Virgibacillus massiliensis]